MSVAYPLIRFHPLPCPAKNSATLLFLSSYPPHQLAAIRPALPQVQTSGFRYGSPTQLPTVIPKTGIAVTGNWLILV